LNIAVTSRLYSGDMEMQQTTIYRLPKVKTITGLSRSTIYAEVAKGKFPAPVSLTDEGRAVGWDSNAVDAWVASRVQAMRSKVGGAV
jgi:prophage regulatory protein